MWHPLGAVFEALKQHVSLEKARETFCRNFLVLGPWAKDEVGVILPPRNPMLGGESDGTRHTFLAVLISGSVCSFLLGCVLALLISRVMSKEMKLQAELAEQSECRRRAEASSKYKSQFLANMSHELRTPMAAVIGLLDVLLGDEYMTSEQVAMVSQIRQCSNALLRLLNNILDLSKVESGKLVLEETDFDIRQELEVLVDMFSIQCAERNIEVVLDLEDDFPGLLRGDSARTVQVFANLIANAIKFTTSGHVIIRGYCDTDQTETYSLDKPSSGSSEESLSRSASANADGSIEPRQDRIRAFFEVEDTGQGIDPSKWEEIFDSFVQAETSTTRQYGGSGLGLCIVRSLVRKMGGEIKVAKKDGPGTLMKFHLCFKRSKEAPGPADFKATCKSTFSPDILRRSKILFSLQGQALRATMTRWVKRWGLDVIDVGSWEETVEELDELLFQEDQDRTLSPNLQPLAVVDINLISGASDLDEMDRFIQQGVLIGWLLNPDTSNTLKEALRKRGYSVMATKPLYKSKLLELLRMLVGNCDFSARTVRGANLSKKPERHRRSSLEEVRDSAAQAAVGHSSHSNKSFEPAVGHSSNSNKSFERCSLDSALKTKAVRRIDSDRRRSANDYSIYKPTNYLDPELINRGNFRSVVTARPFENLKEDSRLEQSSAVPSSLGSSTGLESPSQFAEVSLYSVKDLLLAASNELERSSKAHKLAEERLLPKSSSSGVTNIQAHEEGNGNMDSIPEGSAQLRPMQQRETCSPNAPMEKKGIPGFADGLLPSGSDKTLVLTEGSNSVHLTIPKAPSNSAPPRTRLPRQSPSDRSRGGSRDALKGIKILLAEDTPVLERVATRMLENLGATVVAVSDGLQAFHALTDKCELEEPNSDNGTFTPRKAKYQDPHSLPFDVVLMDCQMPVMDGYEATRKIRDCEQGTGCRIPIIALTAHAMSSDEAKCLQVGMDAYLTKPIDAKLMISTIASFSKNAERRTSPVS